MLSWKVLLGMFASAVWIGAVTPVYAGTVVVNGDFEGTWNEDADGDFVPAGWTKHTGATSADLPALGSVADNGSSSPGSAAVHWVRVTSSSTGDDIGVGQVLNVPAAANLRLSLDVKVISHSLDGGGNATPATEWPVVIDLDYTLASDPGQTQKWRHGFYLNPPGDGRVVDPGSGLIPEYEDTEVPAGVWTAHGFNLTAELPDLGVITSILIRGHGHAYEGQVDNVVIDVVIPQIPTASQWGLTVMVLLLLAAGTITFARRRSRTQTRREWWA